MPVLQWIDSLKSSWSNNPQQGPFLHSLNMKACLDWTYYSGHAFFFPWIRNYTSRNKAWPAAVRGDLLFFPCKWWELSHLDVERILFSFSLKFGGVSLLHLRVSHSRPVFLAWGMLFQYVILQSFICFKLQECLLQLQFRCLLWPTDLAFWSGMLSSLPC